ncbi:unnamed protein product, partial [Prorocentrum cordatum]
MGKRKRTSQLQQAVISFWSHLLEGIDEDRDAEGAGFCLPCKFASTGEYFSGLRWTVLKEARALAREAWYRASHRPLTARLGAHTGVHVPKSARQGFVRGRPWTFRAALRSRPPREWPSLRTAWLVELVPCRGRLPPALFVVTAGGTWGGAEQPLHLSGFAPGAWGWADDGGEGAPGLLEECGLRPLEDLVPLLRMWTACSLAPQPKLLRGVLGLPEPTHRKFSDSEEEEGPDVKPSSSAQGSDGVAGAAPPGAPLESAHAPQLEGLNGLQRAAVGHIMSDDCFTHRCHLLQGPPGTGKTRTVVALLQLLARQSRADGGAKQLLVSAPSNGAVQVALEGFLSSEEASRTPLCLVGVDERVPQDGPLRQAFLHTRARHSLEQVEFFDGCRTADALNAAVEALEALRLSAPSAFSRLGMPAGRPVTGAQLQRSLAASGQSCMREGEPSSDSEASWQRLELEAARAEQRAGGEPSSDSEASWQRLELEAARAEQPTEAGPPARRAEARKTDRAADGGRTGRDSPARFLGQLRELARLEREGEGAALEEEQLRSSRAVFCTLSCSGRASMQWALHKAVDTVLVDEAAQAVEAETVIPLCLLPRQLVLVGDPMQLSATVCHSPAARAGLYCRSMMERLMSSGHDYVMLEEQYRMHPEISRFPSARFYGGRLVDVARSPAAGGQDDLLAGLDLPSYVVVNVSGGKEVCQRNGRAEMSNPHEASAVVRVARRIAAAAPESAIVVITFYNGQAHLLRSLLREGARAPPEGPGAPRVVVHTVDSFQGSEADVVLLSFVRANRERRLGFLSEFRRLNVALTRARRALLVFANVDCLAPVKGRTPPEDDVGALFADAQARGAVWTESRAAAALGTATSAGLHGRGG